jgi:hypothetical protein
MIALSCFNRKNSLSLAGIPIMALILRLLTKQLL